MEQLPEAPVSLPDGASTSPQRRNTTESGDQHVTEGVTTIENDGTGDNWQIMVSTNSKVLHGINKGRGWRNRQLGGNLADASVQQISADMVAIGTQPRIKGIDAAPDGGQSLPNTASEGKDSNFGERHGPGHPLSDENPECSNRKLLCHKNARVLA